MTRVKSCLENIELRMEAKVYYTISKILLEMDHTFLSLYKKLNDLDRNLKQTTFVLLSQKFLL